MKKRFIIYSLLLILLLAFAVSFIIYAGIWQRFLDYALLKAASDFDEIWHVKLLLKIGADVNARNKYGTTALMYACFRPKIDIAQVLLQNGADVSARNSRGETILMKVTNDMYNIGVIQLLLENGADVNEKDNCGRTPLMYAVDPLGVSSAIWYDGVDLLLESGADINATDNNGVTALIRVIDGCHRASVDVVNVVEILVEHGADVNAMTDAGCRALDYADYSPYTKLPQLLLDAGAIHGSERCVPPNAICT